MGIEPRAARLPVRLLGCVSVMVGGVGKQSQQLGGGEQSAALDALSRQLLELLAASASRSLVTADSLADGLVKVADGRLSPAAVSFLVQRIENEGTGPHGWILRVDGLAAHVEPRSAQGLGPTVSLTLTPTEHAVLVRAFVDLRFADMPHNLWAPTYTDVVATVLHCHDKSFQARQFGGMTATTHGETQERFNALYAVMAALCARIAPAAYDACR